MSGFGVPGHQLCQSRHSLTKASLPVTSASRSHQTASGDSGVRFLASLPSFLQCMPIFGGYRGAGSQHNTLSCASLSSVYTDTRLHPLLCLSAFSSYSILSNQWLNFFPQKSTMKEIRKVSQEENAALGSDFIQRSGICWLVSGFCFLSVSCKLGCINLEVVRQSPKPPL